MLVSRKQKVVTPVGAGQSMLPNRNRAVVISPTHKRTEERAPVWGSEFTSKAATIQGGYSRNRCYAERITVDFGA
jgi:hypothetical protein